MENTEQIYKVPLSAKVDPAVRAAVEELARKDDRPVSNMIERLLKLNPDVQAQMAEIAGVETAAA
jgi:predicted transcriptional regulator